AELTVANAGHPPPLLIDEKGKADYLIDGRSIPLGLDPAARRPDAEPIRLVPTSSLLLFTDGLTDAIERKGEDGLAAAREAADGWDASPTALCAGMLPDLSPPHPDDDVCLLAVTLQSA